MLLPRLLVSMIQILPIPPPTTLESVHIYIQIGLILAGGIAIYTQLRGTVKWHTTWIKEKIIEDRKRDETLSMATRTMAEVSTLVHSHDRDLERLKDLALKK